MTICDNFVPPVALNLSSKDANDIAAHRRCPCPRLANRILCNRYSSSSANRKHISFIHPWWNEHIFDEFSEYEDIFSIHPYSEL